MKQSSLPADRLSALILALGALLLRLPHLGWGLPGVEEEALPMKKAFAMWGWESGHLTLDPGTAGWPALSFYLQLGLQKLQYVLGRLGGRYDDVYDYFVSHTDPASLLVMSRLPSVLCASIVVYVSVRLAQRLTNQQAAVTSGLFLALSPMFLEQSQMVTPDMYLMLFSTLALASLLQVYQHGRQRDYVFSAVWIALGTACKYTPIVLTLTLYVTHLLRLHREGHRLAWLGWRDRRLGVAALFCAGTFVLASPYTLLNSATLRRDVGFQFQHMSRGHFGHESLGPAFVVHLFQSLPHALGWLGLVASVLGLVGVGVTRRGPWLVVWGMLLPLYLALGSLHTKTEYYVLPLLVPLSLGVAAAIWALQKSPRSARFALWILVALAVTIPQAQKSWSYHVRAARASTIQVTQRYLESHLVPRQSIVAMEFGTPTLRQDPVVQYGSFAAFRRLSTLQRRRLLQDRYYLASRIPMYIVEPEKSDFYYDIRHYVGFDYIVVSGLVRRRYVRQPERFPRQVAFYADLDKYARLEHRERSAPNRRGSEISIYRILPEDRHRILAEKPPLQPGFQRRFRSQVVQEHFLWQLERMGIAAMSKSLWGVAERYLDALLEESAPQTHIEQWARLVTVKLHGGNYKSALPLALALQKARPRLPQAVMLVGQCYEMAGQTERAIGAYERVLQLDSRKSSAGPVRQEARKALVRLRSH